MVTIKNYFIDKQHSIDIELVKSRFLSNTFQLSTNSIIGFINTFNHPTITFVFEKKCEKETLLCLSKLFLMTIQKSYLNQVKLSGFRLFLNSHAISTPFHFFGKQTNLFCHSIILRPSKHSFLVANTTIQAKEFAITTLNEFTNQIDGIFK